MLAALGTACSVVLITGCVGFEGKPTGEQVSKRKVRVEFTVCAAGSSPDCSETGKTENTELRLLLGLRVPRGTDVPDHFEPIGRDEEVARNGRYSRQLNELAPTPKGSKWHGFVSEPFEHVGGEPSSARFRLRLGLPDEIGKRFKWRPAVGFIRTTDAVPANAPVDCGEDPYNQAADSNAVCIDTPDNRRATRRSYRIKIQ